MKYWKYWVIPLGCALLVSGFQLIWNSTQYHNPISDKDIQLAGITLAIVYGVVYNALITNPSDEG